MSEITIKEVYRLIENVEIRLVVKIEKVYDAFLRLEEGKVTQLLEDVARYKVELSLIKRIVYSACGFVLLAVLSSIIYLVIKR